MTLYGVLALLTSGSVAALNIGPVQSEHELIKYNGLKAEENWSMEYGLEPQVQSQSSEKVSEGTIPAFAFESRGHMERMVLEWGRLYAFNVSLAMRGGPDDWVGMSKAFQMIEDTRPPVAVWLLEYKDGRATTLEDIGKAFQRTQGFTRHIVFHWSPEFCDQGTATFQRVKTAYEHAASVFQFGYQDERLAALDNNKFKPWPLGAAWWKGWESPSSQLATERRVNLASFRGALDTHGDLGKLQSLFSETPDVIIEDSGHWTANDSDESKTRYKVLLETSTYGLNLAGHNPNCYRMFEAIESGAIPVIVARKGLHQCYDNWSGVYGHAIGTQYDWIPKAPFEALEDWDELPHRLEEMSSQAEARSSALKVWYEQWRQSFTEAFASSL